jgi:hypothetical protein
LSICADGGTLVKILPHPHKIYCKKHAFRLGKYIECRKEASNFGESVQNTTVDEGDYRNFEIHFNLSLQPF